MSKKRGSWTINGSETRYEDDFIRVQVDDVIQPDGEPSTYSTVRMKSGVAILPLDDDDNVYLVKQFRYALGAESLETISGGIDEGEEAQASAEREILEEAGITASEWQSLGEMQLETSITQAPVHLFLVRGLRFREASPEGSEELECLRMPFSEAVARVMSGEIVHSPSCVLLLKAARILGR